MAHYIFGMKDLKIVMELPLQLYTFLSPMYSTVQKS